MALLNIIHVCRCCGYVVSMLCILCTLFVLTLTGKSFIYFNILKLFQTTVIWITPFVTLVVILVVVAVVIVTAVVVLVVTTTESFIIAYVMI